MRTSRDPGAAADPSGYRSDREQLRAAWRAPGAPGRRSGRCTRGRDLLGGAMSGELPGAGCENVQERGSSCGIHPGAGPIGSSCARSDALQGRRAGDPAAAPRPGSFCGLLYPEKAARRRAGAVRTSRERGSSCRIYPGTGPIGALTPRREHLGKPFLKRFLRCLHVGNIRQLPTVRNNRIRGFSGYSI